MKSKMKHIAIMLIAFVMIIGTVAPLYAASGIITNPHWAGNLFTATGKGPDTDHTSCTYAIDNSPAWCIDAGVAVKQGEGYNPAHTIDDSGALSWLMYNSSQMGGGIDNQVVQAAVWHLTGNTIASAGGDLNQVWSVIAQAQACNNGISAASASINVDGGNTNFTYTRGYSAHGTVYLSAPITFGNTSSATISGAPGGTQFVDMNGNAVGGSVGNGTFRIMVPAQNVTSDMHIVVNAASNSSAEGYGPAQVWIKEGSQTLITPTRRQMGGAGASAGFNLTAVGDLKIAKNDEWNKPVANATFKVTGPHGYSNTITTKADGTFELQGLRIGTYTITETNVGQNLYISANTMNVQVGVQSGKVQTYSGINEYKRGSAQLQKLDIYEGLDPKGDSILENAVYELHAKTDIKEGPTLVFTKDETIITVKTDRQGKTPVVKNVFSTLCNTTLDGLPVGEYYWKEIIPSKGFNLNPDVVEFSVQNETDLYTPDLGTENNEHNEVPIKGKVKVYKMDNDNNNNENENDTDKNSAAGAELRLTLISDPSEFYDVVINEDGAAEFIDEDFKAKYPGKECTIPFGLYEITETKASDSGEHTYYYIQPTKVNVDVEAETEQRILMDEPVPMYLNIIKIDKDSGKVVKLAGAKFKIWDCQNDEFVTQMITPSGEFIDEFETNENGYFYTPQQLYPGKYIVYETEAPEGYYGDEEWRLPANEADYGVEGKGGILVEIDKEGLGLTEDAEFPLGGVEVGALVYKTNIGNTPLKGKLQIEKTGEKLDSSTTTAVEEGEKYTLNYKNVGLEGVVYEIRAAEDIMSPDGTHAYHKAGDFIENIKTDENGIAISSDLYLGEYTITEVVTPEGYITDKNIPNVVLENADKTVKVKTTVKELNNIRQKLNLAFNKDYTEVKYSTSQELDTWAVFGVYASKDMENYKGEVVVPQDGLLDVITVEGEETYVSSNIDLPAGNYYVKELKASYPYTISQERKYVALTHSGNSEEYLTIQMQGFTNDYEKATVTLIKISTSSLGNVTLEGSQLNVEDADATMKQILDDIKGLPENEVIDYLADNNIKFVAGAEYSVFVDEECETPLLIKNEETGKFEEAKLVTNNTGIIKIEGLPIGQYYLKETYAPAGYQISNEVVEIYLTREDKDITVYQVLKDNEQVENFLTKTDMFTGEAIANCVFEIKDMDENVIVHSITDENGEGYIPVLLLEKGKTYTYTEIEAPEIYDLNTEPHEFVADYEINEETGKVEWGKKIHVENRRKESTVTLEKLDFADSTAIPNCKFELKSLETDFVVEGVTDENGIYVFENIPYGKYTYTELEAPEEYMIDTEPHEIEINAEEMKIQVTNEKAPETGDIAVIALAAVAVLSIVGIVFVIAKNRKKASKRA